MNPRHKTLLKELGIDRWVRPDLPSETADAPVPTVPVLTIAQENDDMAKRGRPRKHPDVSSIASAVPVSPTLPRPPAFAVPQDWEGLRAAVKNCERCKLCPTRTNTVFGVGIENAPLLVVGEGPGADEDAIGQPFVGRAGKLLDEMLKSIGRSRDKNVFIANVVKCRPPGNRDPEPDEVEACRPYLEQQIKLIQPKLILGLGRIAAQRLLNTQEPLSRLRGPMFEYGETKTPLFITYHPAYLLRSPREKAKSWEDLKKVHRFLEQPSA